FARCGGGGWHHSACFLFLELRWKGKDAAHELGYAPFAPLSHLPGASPSPPPFRDERQLLVRHLLAGRRGRPRVGRDAPGRPSAEARRRRGRVAVRVSP